MSTNSIIDRLAVCSWSLQPETPRALLDQVKQIGIPRLQIALDPIRQDPERWNPLPDLCSTYGVELVSGMFGTVGEDYSTLESIRLTGGIVPDSTWNENWRNIQSVANWAKKLGLGLVTFHAGFLPEEESDPEYAKLQKRIRQVADLFGAGGMELAFETGQERAPVLRDFLAALGCSNVGVNFDPANMILYDKGDPVEALRQLAPWLKQCHLKDANRTRQPGTWGEEVPVGTGQVNWPAFFAALDEVGFKRYLAIEREAGQQRLSDITTARRLVESLSRESGASR